MATNDFNSNITEVLARVFLEKFESTRVLSKNVDTQLLAGKFNPSTGDTVTFKRPTDYLSVRTPAGDISSTATEPGATERSAIVTGKASGIVQDYFTVSVDYDEADEAIKMDQIDQLLAPMATRIVTDLELDFADFMMGNAGLLAGTPGVPVDAWKDVAEAGAVMSANGIPKDDMWFYTVNPFTQTALAEIQRSLGSGGVSGELVDTAHQKSIISDNFAGMRVMTATTLASFVLEAVTDTAGALTSTPDAQYISAKDTMTQVFDVSGFGTANITLPKGTVFEVPIAKRLNLSTRKVVVNAAGSAVPWTGVLTKASTLSSGAQTGLVLSGPAIFEEGGGLGAFNTVSKAIVSGNIINLLGPDAAAPVTLQPNLFWHKQAFSIGSVPIKKLHSTDTLAETEDGLQFRVSKGVQFLENKQEVRFDFRPAYSVLNPFFAGQGWGV